MPVQVDSVADLEAVLAADLIEPSEVEGAYNAAVTEVSQVEAEAGIATTTRRWTALRVAQAAAAQVVAVVTAAFIRALGFFDVTNDGAGSGLDADLLDGQEAAAFASSVHTHTAADIASGTLDEARLPVVSIAKGGTGQVTAQAAINALTQVSLATPEHVLTKDTASGNAVFKAVPSGGTPSAADVTFAPAGSVAATNVQAAIEEVDAEKEPLLGFVPLDPANNLSDVAAQQTALNNVTAVASATNEHILTKDTATGNAVFKAAPAGTGDLSAADIDTLAELNAIITDATLIDTTDARLSDERTPLDNSATNAKLADVAQDTIKGRVSVGAGDPEDLTAAQVRTLLNVEDGATADQTNAEIETAYNAQVAAASQAEMEAGTEPGIRRVSPLLVAQAIAALAGGGSPNAFLVTRKVVAASGNSSGMGLYRITGASVILTFTSADIADTLFTCAIKNENGSDATLATEGAETIEGLASMTLQSGFSVWLYSDGTNLRQIAQ